MPATILAFHRELQHRAAPRARIRRSRMRLIRIKTGAATARAKQAPFHDGIERGNGMRPIGEYALLTDFYQLTMLQAYHLQGMNDIATFEFSVRRLPPERNFLLAAGLEQVVEYLEGLCFSAEELDWLRASGRFDAGFVDSLRQLRFTGSVDAMPEGSVFFEGEPILRLTAPLREAQLVESRLINLLHLQTLVASKAVRCVLAAGGRQLVDFGLRRAHGAESGLLSARASYLAGFDGSATVLAGMRFGLPVFGTMAHSFVQAHDSEAQAFAAFARAFPGGTTLLIDTYDTEQAAHEVVRLSHAPGGQAIRGVRIDSGDLGETARRVRAIFDAGGCERIRIFASGNLDENAVAELVAQGAPIDGFGVGTRMNTSNDAPYLDCAYKLVSYAGMPRRKRSAGKASWPGAKQVYRHLDGQGTMQADLLTLAEEAHAPPAGMPMLQPVMRNGRRTGPLPTLEEARAHARAQIAALPPALRALKPAPAYPVAVSDALRRMVQQVDAFALKGDEHGNQELL